MSDDTRRRAGRLRAPSPRLSGRSTSARTAARRPRYTSRSRARAARAGSQTLGATGATGTTGATGATGSDGGVLTPRVEEIILDPTELPITISGGDIVLSYELLHTPDPDSVIMFLNRTYQTQGIGEDYSLTGTDLRRILWQVDSGTGAELDQFDRIIVHYMSAD